MLYNGVAKITNQCKEMSSTNIFTNSGIYISTFEYKIIIYVPYHLFAKSIPSSLEPSNKLEAI